MYFRIYNKLESKYEDSSKTIAHNGEIVGLKNKIIGGWTVTFSPAENFIVEPWTGYFDKNGKKIYNGDILEQYSIFDFKSKVVWKNGGFMMVPIDPEGIENTMGYSGILKGWTITGNIHEVEYSEGK